MLRKIAQNFIELHIHVSEMSDLYKGIQLNKAIKIPRSSQHII